MKKRFKGILIISAVFTLLPATPIFAVNGDYHDSVSHEDSINISFDGTDTGTAVPKQRAAEYSAAGFGPATMTNISSRTLSYSFFLGRIWEVNPFAGIRAMADVTTDFRNSAVASLGLGLQVMPFPEEFSPYVAGEFGLGYAREDGTNFFGFNAAGALGIMLFRSATAQMVLEGKAGFLFDDLENGFPSIYTVRIGILF